MAQTILITGANRGIGLALTEAAVARGDTVIAVVRTPSAAEGLNALASLTGKVAIEEADVTDEAAMVALGERLATRALDVAVANAGVLNSYGGLNDPAHNADAWRDVLMTNVFGVFTTVRTVLPSLRRGQAKKFAVLSSVMGSSARSVEKGNAYPYRAAKAAATNVARNLAGELRPEGIAVGAYHPGWVRTEMGGPSADIDTATSASGLLERFDALSLATTGVFEDYSGEPIPF